ncbi:putative ATPase [Armatimonadetes bacterium GBS]|nr:MAG: ATPase AAA [Fimbriimonadales bacterium]CUU04629.1 putative ATPase [Armatimonadetes bacterium GBS]CUU38171.1 putative ATPase [Armatimonadetes bacterium GXS]
MQADLFGEVPQTALPLATRMRPRTLEEFVGQTHLLAPGMPLRQAIEQGTLGSVILWAPPGCGKTSLAYLIAHYSNAFVESHSAVSIGVSEIRKIAERARQRRRTTGQPTLLLLDEIHHFNRTQQDALLGYLEDGTFTLVGATTENPFFILSNALLSRARVLTLKPLSEEELGILIDRALQDEERGLGARHLQLAPDARAHLIRTANGDARLALNVLESAALQTPEGGTITLEVIEQLLQKPFVRYDQQGDYHYDTISAFIKSVRGSDPDAALHYLARMLEAGEDPRFIMRRLLILASEDVGNANPLGLVVASAGAQAVERVGMPEAQIILAHVTTYLAASPKSNASYVALQRALHDVRTLPLTPIPMHLRNAPHPGLKALGHGEGYLYPHDFPEGWVEQTYIPEGDWNLPYYEPTEHGHEARIRAFLERLKKREPSDG